MPVLAANLSWLFTELPFVDRFAAAAASNFRCVEMLYPYELSAEEVALRLKHNGLELALFNLPPGDVAAGERGLASVPGREEAFAAALDTALRYAARTGCTRLHAMAGNRSASAPPEAQLATYHANLRIAAERCALAGVTVLIEPLNPIENPIYFLQTVEDALATIAAVGHSSLSLQLDLYHLQRTAGDLERRIRELAGRFAHVQIAGVPHRNEPDRGEVDFRHVLGVLDDIGYDGRVGCEYRPVAGTSAGLGWAAPYLATG